MVDLGSSSLGLMDQNNFGPLDQNSLPNLIFLKNIYFKIFKKNLNIYFFIIIFIKFKFFYQNINLNRNNLLFIFINFIFKKN